MYATLSLFLCLFVCVLLVAVVLGWIADVKQAREHASDVRSREHWSAAGTGSTLHFARSARAARSSHRATAPRPRPLSRDELEEARHSRVLGLQEATTPRNVRQAYRSLMLVHHPDRVVGRGPEAEKNAEEVSKQVNEAYRYFRRRLDF